MRPPPCITVGIPLFNEEENIPELLRRVRGELDVMAGGPHTLLLVDDGSRDRTPELLEQFVTEMDHVVVVRLSRNFGHQAAITAALEHAEGDVVILMDGDLQDDPAAIPRFVEKYREGFDVVYAKRVARKEGMLKRGAYHLFYRTIRGLSDVPLPVDSGDFSLLSRRVVDAMNSATEYHRYVRGLRAWAGFRQVGMDVERQQRNAGEPKYSLGKLVRLALDGVFSFSLVPLRIATIMGLVMVFLSGLFGLYALADKFFGDGSPRGFTAVILTVIMMGGVQLVVLGILGEYIGRIYNEAKGRPPYVIDRVLRREKS